MGMPPLPPLPRSRVSSGKPRKATKSGKKRKSYNPNDLDRTVNWREKQEDKSEPEHVYGTCARCKRRRPALDLVWTPDRIVFGEWKQGYWHCKGDCED